MLVAVESLLLTGSSGSGAVTTLASSIHVCNIVVLTANGQGKGKILQRFPEKDWENCPFTQGIELVSMT